MEVGETRHLFGDGLYCPKCEKALDAGTQITSDVSILDTRDIETGDISICAYCHNINIFEVEGQNKRLRNANEKEIEGLRTEYPEEYNSIMKMQKFGNNGNKSTNKTS